MLLRPRNPGAGGAAAEQELMRAFRGMYDALAVEPLEGARFTAFLLAGTDEACERFAAQRFVDLKLTEFKRLMRRAKTGRVQRYAARLHARLLEEYVLSLKRACGSLHMCVAH